MSDFRVLIVEDDPMVAEVNRAYVEGAGPFAVVGTARTGREGVQMVAALAPDLVVLDIYMPDQDGLEALREIRRQGRPTDVLMVTAAHDVRTIQEVLRQGAIDYIIKPFKFERIRSTLHAYAQMRHRLTDAETLSQAELDQLAHRLGAYLGPETTGRPAPQTDRALPKGLTDWTLRQVLLYLVNHEGPLSASEVGDGIGLARVTVRRYLDYLVQLGRLGVELHYAPVGRPVTRYFLR